MTLANLMNYYHSIAKLNLATNFRGECLQRDKAECKARRRQVSLMMHSLQGEI